MNVLMNGKLLPVEQSLFDQDGWLTGTGIFETIKTQDSKPWALSRHMRRMVNCAFASNIKPPNEEVLRKAISGLLEVEKHDSGVLRLFFDSNGTWGATHREFRKFEKPALVATYSKAVDGMTIKSYPYHHRLQILNEIKSQGMDEAIVINSSGKISEGSVTNLLLKIDGRWCTPPISDGALPGIVRALVVENFDVTVRSIPREEVQSIESGFLLSSLRIAQPIESIDARILTQSLEFQSEIEAMALRTSVG